MRALFYDGRTSGARPAILAITSSGGGALLTIRAGEIDTTVPLAAVTIGERVGAVNRLLQLSDGGSLEVLDNLEFDRALDAAGARTAEAPIRGLESRWRYAVLAILATLIGTAAFLKYGVPALATRALRVIPPGVDAVIGTDTLRFLDRSTFKPSNLTPVRQAQLRELFAEVTAGASPDSKHFRLELRRVGSIGANALALPSGIVVLTDELEHLAKNDDELRGVFAHEVGHLVNRHAMRMLLQSSATALLLVGILGDVSGVSSLVTAAPTVLVNAAYSRDFEREADGFAFRWMSQHGVAPERLGDLLKRLAVAQSGDQDGYLASHPDLGERIRAARSHRETAR